MLKKLAVHHVLWLQMLNNLGCEQELAKDLVQDMYLRLHRLVKNEQDIMYFNDVNKFFVYKVLKNYVDGWETYDKALFNLYFGVIINKDNKHIDKTRSLREVAKKCNLGLSSIHQQVKGYKGKLREEFSEDIEDYFNQDFDITK